MHNISALTTPLRGMIVRTVRFSSHNTVATFCVLFLLFLVLVAAFGPSLGVGDPTALKGKAFTGPSAQFPMGSDHLGRDVLARLVAALRVSVIVSLLAATLAGVLGSTLGIVSGYFKGVLDETLMRFMDVMFAFPSLLMAVVIITVVGTGVEGVMITVMALMFPAFTRIVRGSTLSIKEAQYVAAAVVLGANHTRIMFRHILPNVMAPILVQFSYAVSVALVIEGSLSFLGLGVQPPTPSLGSLVRDGKLYLESAPWIAFFPGLSLAIAIIAINVLGDWLRDMLDPKLRGERV